MIKESFVTIHAKYNPEVKRTDAHVLLYHKSGDYYYFVDKNSLFAQKDEQIAVLRKQNEEFKAEMEAYKEEMNSKYAKLASTFKDTSTTLIEMVEKLQEANK